MALDGFMGGGEHGLHDGVDFRRKDRGIEPGDMLEGRGEAATAGLG